MLEIGSTFQPVPLFVGPTAEGNFSSYVIVDDVRYDVESVRGAIHITFQVAHCLDTRYPKESEQILQFLEQAVYGINYNVKKNTISMNRLLNVVQSE